MNDAATTPPNPFDPSHPQHATWPQPFEPGRDEAEIAMIEYTGATMPGAFVADDFTPRKRRDVRRLIAEEVYEQRVRSILGQELTKIYRTASAQILYFRDPGRIADYGDKLSALGGMNEALAAKRIVALAVSPERGWKSIAFTGSANFVELAMTEALTHGLTIQPQGPEQAAILAKLVGKKQGGMGAAAGPAAITRPPVDPILDMLAELDQLPTQTSPRTAPTSEPVAPPPAPAQQPESAPRSFVGVMPLHLNLGERLKERRERQQLTPAKPNETRSPARKPGLGL